MSRCPQLVSTSLLAVLLAGCSGGGDKPAALPTLTLAPSPTATVAPVPPAALAKTQLGADAFVRYFFTQLNAAFRSSDSSRIRALRNGECETCIAYEKALDAAKQEGSFLADDSFVVSDVAAAPLQVGGTTVDVFGTIPERRKTDAQGHEVGRVAASGKFHLTVYVKPSATGWVVSAIVRGKG